MSSSTSVQELIKAGEQLGLKGAELQAFLKVQQAQEREDRAAEREREKEREDRLAREKEQERQENEKERQSQLELKRLEAQIKRYEIEEARLEAGSNRSSGEVATADDVEVEDNNEGETVIRRGYVGEPKFRGPKIVPYDEKDEMDSYLQRFERYADVQGWKKESWAIYLSALLRGRSLDVYSRLTPDQAKDYDTLRNSLLRAYSLTEEGYKAKFQECKPDVGESPPQFLVRLESYFTKWVTLAKAEQTYEGLKSLLVRERYLATCSKPLEMFLRERAISDLDELGKLAEQYEDAHGAKSTVRPVQKPYSPNTLPKRQWHNKRSSNPRPNRGQIKPICFICGRSGHIARNCFKKTEQAGAVDTSGDVGYVPEDEPVEEAQVMSFRNQNSRRSTTGQQFQSSGRSSQPSQQPFVSACPTQPDQSNFVPRYRSQAAPQQSLRCRAHARPLCPECICVNPAERHDCGAMLDTEVTLSCGCTVPLIAEACSLGRQHGSKMPIAEGTLFDKPVRVLRDTGCSTVVVRRSLVPDSCLTGETVICGLIDGTLRRNPVARISVDTPFLKGEVKATCMSSPMYDLIVGNIPQAEDLNWSCKVTRDSEVRRSDVITDNPDVATQEVQAVTTRAQARQEHKMKLLKVTESIDTELSPDELSRLQIEDQSLSSWFEKAKSQITDSRERGPQFRVKNGILWRVKEEQGREVKQLAVPQPLRDKVMKLGHDCIMSGHQGIKKTYDRITREFFWPGVSGDVSRYCQSCDICQRTVPKGRVSKVPLTSMPLIDRPFERVAVDLVGPIAPITERGNRYILTMVDYATRYPEATALKTIEAETVAEALVTMFSRVGVPEEVLSDQGSQFTSKIMQEVGRLLSIKQLHTTVYHPMCNGLVERFNGTLKAMLRRMCSERPKDWDRYLPALLFAYREVPQESLGFSPFEMIYGRSIRGPMNILKEVWTKQTVDPDVKTTYEYVLDLQNRLQCTCEMAKQELQKAQGKQKRYFDTKSKDRVFYPGDKVLLLLPSDDNKLLMQWKGPFEVIERVHGHDYRVMLTDRVKMFHANMLKRYTARESEEEPELHEIAAVVVEEQLDVPGGSEQIHECVTEQKETYRDVNISPELSADQKQEVEELLLEFADIFTDVPKVTNLGEHNIELTSSDPLRIKPYPIPFALRAEVNREIDSMLRNNIIEPSTAPYSSPIVVVKKSDGSNRICIDYRKLNKITVFDPEPMPQMQEIFSGLTGSQYFSKFDFCKGYWQVPMRSEVKDLTTFASPDGLYRFRVMPFGLVNAPATFSRIMRQLLHGLRNLRNYLDDVLSHTADWSKHPVTLREFFSRVRAANLALKPSKCFIGYTDLVFLGHKLGRGSLSPNDDLISKIQQAPAPTTKKQLRSFLGLVGYYRAFVPNFAAIAVPLTDLTQKGKPDKLVWTDVQEQAFQTLKRHVCVQPVLRLPDISKQFILQTDASAEGIGAVLFQEVEGVKHPVAYASKKLLPRERNYSTIEREALAVIWGVQKFQNYLMGTHFILETDHSPLQYLDQAKFQNSRIMRWTLLLQPYRFTLRAIKGSENVGADYLSRYT